MSSRYGWKVDEESVGGMGKWKSCGGDVNGCAGSLSTCGKETLNKQNGRNGV